MEKVVESEDKSSSHPKLSQEVHPVWRMVVFGKEDGAEHSNVDTNSIVRELISSKRVKA